MSGMDITCPTCGTTVGKSSIVQVGDILHGYCGGYFGRDLYACKRVEAVGPDWVVCRDLDGYVSRYPVTATGKDIRRDLAGYRDAGTDCTCEASN
jgi:hypothetical protein